jgi:hypothetical protein
MSCAVWENPLLGFAHHFTALHAVPGEMYGSKKLQTFVNAPSGLPHCW